MAIIKNKNNIVHTKTYGLREHLDPIKPKLSDVIHSCAIDALQYTPEKRVHRFFPLEKDDFFYPQGRTERYLKALLSTEKDRRVKVLGL